MKNYIFVLFLFGTNIFAQVGIGTTTPNARLDISTTSITNPLSTDGVLIPKMNIFPTINPTLAQDGMLVFITGNGVTTKGFYFWDQTLTSWIPVGGNSGVKQINDLADGKSDNDGTQNGSSVFLGVNAGLVDDSSDNKNVGIGFQALMTNIIGYNNTAIGYYAMLANTTGYNNAANGVAALYFNTVGKWNTATGFEALFNNTIGDYNTATGTASLFFNTVGKRNTANGVNALPYNTTGNNNTATGVFSLYNNTTGNYNTAIGYQAGWNQAVLTNVTAIGNSTLNTSSNQVRIGNNTVTSIGGFAAWTNVSDARFKKNIKEDVKGLDFILKLRPVTYNLDLDKIDTYLKIPDSISKGKKGELIKYRKLKEKEIQTGFIAQEVAQAAKELNYDFSGVDKPKNENDYYGLRYAEFVVPLVKAIQEQQKIIKVLKNKAAKIDDLQNQINTLKQLITAKNTMP